MASIGRNDKCPCGSGQKYKKCCLQNGSKGIVEASVQKLKDRSIQRSEEYGEKSPLYFRDLNGVRKMSEIILDFAQPLLDKTDGSLEGQKKALSVATIAWNIALMDDIDEQLEKLEDHMRSEDDQFLEDMSVILSSLVQRKLDFYSDVKRMVMDYDIVDTGEGFHLNVVSSLMKDDKDGIVFEKEAEKIYGTKEIYAP
jgi:hypothetical protein